MLIVTDRASHAITAMLTATPGAFAAGGLRISSDSGTHAGAGFALSLPSMPNQDDHVLETAGVRVFVTTRAYPAVQDKVLDARQASGGQVDFTLVTQAVPEADPVSLARTP